MITAFLLKSRRQGVSTETFREYMRTERPDPLTGLPDVESYDLWFTDDTSDWDSVEAITVADEAALNRVFDSDIASGLHEEGSKFIDFDTEELIVSTPDISYPAETV